MKNNTIQSFTEYKATGEVLGYLWGGGEGSYPTVKLTGKTKEDILKQGNELLESGELDSGMGFESLIGAVLQIEVIETKMIDGKNYVHTEYIEEIIGDLNEEQEEAVREALYYR